MHAGWFARSHLSPTTSLASIDSRCQGLRRCTSTARTGRMLPLLRALGGRSEGPPQTLLVVLFSAIPTLLIIRIFENCAFMRRNSSNLSTKWRCTVMRRLVLVYVVYSTGKPPSPSSRSVRTLIFLGSGCPIQLKCLAL